MKRYLYTITLLLGTLVSCGQTVSKFIIVDQFGYLPDSKKIAVIKNPQIGFDSDQTFSPGSDYSVIDVKTNEAIFTGSLVSWKNGQTDPSSGDKVWWFDFSSVTESGNYYILDVDKNVRSFEFTISPIVYNEVLRQAVRTFFYQRVGFAKSAQFAGTEWADGASHIGNNQDLNARLYNKSNDATTERDVSGGWYDAGDFNKYTNWTANYVIDLLKAYQENPQAFGDDYNIPESGNEIPDILDEVKWGVDHLVRLQSEDGSVLSIVSESHASPPSSATGSSLYGPASTSATQNTAAALAIASKVYGSIGMSSYSDDLKTKAIKAWDWAVANPDVLFRNNDQAYGSEGIGAGQQEEDDYQRMMGKLKAACFLFEITNDNSYRDFFDANYEESHLIQWNYAYPFEGSNQEILLYYTTLPNATTSVVNDILTVYKNAMNSGADNFPAIANKNDPYMAYLKDYTWGSNSVKSIQGNMYYNMITYQVDASKYEDAETASLYYINYIHGLNPLNMTYLSNMYNYGGDNCVNEFYHTWFTDGSPLWDRVGESTYGPPPGFLVGGANPSYDWDGCCPGGCGSAGNNSVCTSESITPPKDQPVQKSYKDFNTSWPLNSWSVTENSCGYQVNYIRLLSKFVDASLDCNGDKDGTAFIDVCSTCAGGNTGIVPVTDLKDCEEVVTGFSSSIKKALAIYPNPTAGIVNFKMNLEEEYRFLIYNSKGSLVKKGKLVPNGSINLSTVPAGIYSIKLINSNSTEIHKIMKL